MSGDRVPLADFRLVSFLVSRDINFIDVIREPGGRVQFVFDNTDQFQKNVRDYRFGNDLVSARKFVEAQSRLKEIIFDDDHLSQIDGH